MVETHRNAAADRAPGSSAVIQRAIIPWPVPWVPLVCLLFGCLMQVTAPLWDHQYANIGCVILAIVALIALWIRWLLNARTWFVGFVPLLLFGLGVIGFITCFRFVRFTGELVPIFAWRFAHASPKLPHERVTDTAKLASDDSGSANAVETPAADANNVRVPWQTDSMAFPEFLGQSRRAYVAKREFAVDWQAASPTILWQQPIGAGWCGFVISGDRCFTMEEREVDGTVEEWITCYSVFNGALLWHHGYPSRHYHPFGGAGPRATPTLAGDYVIAQGATGILSCLRADSGALVWKQDLHQLLGLDQTEAEKSVPWGRSGSPLVDGDRVIAPLGGHDKKFASLIAFSLAEGKEIWRAGDRQISYASPSLYLIDDQPQIVSVNEDNVTGHDPESGKLLWEFPWEGQTNTGASASQAMLVGANRLLLSKAYGGGSALIELTREQEAWVPELLWHHSSLLKTKFTNAVVKDGFAYALSDGILECVDLEAGKSMWKQPRRDRFGQGQVLGVEDVLLVLSEAGTIAQVALDPKTYRELGRFEVLEGTTWNTFAISKQTLLIRNSEMAACVVLPERKD